MCIFCKIKNLFKCDKDNLKISNGVFPETHINGIRVNFIGFNVWNIHLVEVGILDENTLYYSINTTKRKDEILIRAFKVIRDEGYEDFVMSRCIFNGETLNKVLTTITKTGRWKNLTK